jgi:hypothetical protein
LVQPAATISDQNQIIPQDTSSMAVGNPVAGAGIPDGAVIVSVNQFGSMMAVAVGASGGTGYEVGDEPIPTQAGSFGGSLVVTTVGAGGAIIGVDILNEGIGYSVANNLPTTGGHGTGAQINIQSVGPSVTLSVNATATASAAQIQVWNAPIVPFAIINAYIYAAASSLVQARWLALWQMAMGLFVSHFLTLYARSDGNPNANIAQAAAQGLAFGIQTSKAVHDVSVSYTLVGGLEGWGQWNLTVYGQILASYGKTVGSGSMLIW